MSSPATDRDRAVRFYARLVALYPKTHRDQFGPQMQRAFEDCYRHATEGERRVGIGFWLAVLWDECRSIVRERASDPRGDVLFFALILTWVCAVLFAPTIPAVSDWRNLVLPTGILGALFLVVPGSSGIGRRVATLVVVLAVLESAAAAARSINDQTHLLAPALLLAVLAFSIKILGGLNARIIGMKDSVWSADEVLYGALVGLAGIVALGIGAVNTNDGPSAEPFILWFVVPLLCGVAGFKSSRRTLSARSGIYAALGSALIGATIWILAEPLVAEGALMTYFKDHPVPAATLLPYWQSGLGTILFWAAINGVVGAFFGMESFRVDETVHRRQA